MNRGVDRATVFFDDSGRVDFGRLLGIAAQRHDVEVHAYCLMTNHFHLLVRSGDDGVSRFVHDLCGPYARHVNDSIGRDGPLFRGRFHAVPVRTDNHLIAAVRYIHRNPLDLPGVDHVDDYRWSSHRAYLGRRRAAPWMRLDSIMDRFDHRIDRYEEFMLAEASTPPATALSSEVAADLGPLIALVAAEAQHPRAGAQSLARTVATVLLDHDGERVSARADAFLAFPTDGARRSARSRARQRTAIDPDLCNVARRVAALIA